MLHALADRHQDLDSASRAHRVALLGRPGRIEELPGRERVGHADVIELLDEELAFERLHDHHDGRERAGRSSVLDEPLSREELEEPLQCLPSFQTGHAERWVAQQRT